MVSIGVLGARKTLAGWLVLTVLAVPAGGRAQSAHGSSDINTERRIVNAIVQTQQQGGPHAPELIDSLTALGVLYQEDGDHGPAAVAFDRALQVVRANYGLYSLDQAPLLEQAIRNHEERGDIETAWDLERELAALARRNRDDLRAASVLRKIADKRLSQLELYASGKIIPQVVLGCYYQPPYHRAFRSCVSGSRGAAIRWMNADVQAYYDDAVQVFLGQGLYTSAELEELEMALVRTSYEYGSRDGQGYGHTYARREHDRGRASLQRLLDYQVARSEPPVERIRAFVQIADWDLLSAARPDIARSEYVQAYEQLLANGVSQAEIDEIFAPELPVVVPAFMANPLDSPETPASKGFVDVAFEITEQGRPQRVDVLRTTTNASFAEKRSVAQRVQSSRFRPRVAGGKIATAAPVVVRYYLNE